MSIPNPQPIPPHQSLIPIVERVGRERYHKSNASPNYIGSSYSPGVHNVLGLSIGRTNNDDGSPFTPQFGTQLECVPASGSLSEGVDGNNSTPNGAHTSNEGIETSLCEHVAKRSYECF